MSQPIIPPAQKTPAQNLFNRFKVVLRDLENETNYFLNDVNNNNEYFPIILREKFDISKETLEDFLRKSRNANVNMNEGLQADCENMLQKTYDLAAKADNHDAVVRSRIPPVGGKVNRKKTNKRKKGRKHGKAGKKNRRTRRIIKK